MRNREAGKDREREGVSVSSKEIAFRDSMTWRLSQPAKQRSFCSNHISGFLQRTMDPGLTRVVLLTARNGLNENNVSYAVVMSRYDGVRPSVCVHCRRIARCRNEAIRISFGW